MSDAERVLFTRRMRALRGEATCTHPPGCTACSWCEFVEPVQRAVDGRMRAAGVEAPTEEESVGRACATCRHFACICGILRCHDEDCRYRKAATGAVPIQCDHGRDVCPECDPCTCGTPGTVAGEGDEDECYEG